MMTRSLTSITAALTLMLALAPSTAAAAAHAHRPRRVMVASPLHGLGAEKQEPIATQGSVNDAMHGAEVKLLGGWSDIVHSWERTR